MKKSNLLVLSLMACTLLASCDEDNLLIDGSNPVGNVGAVDQNGSSVELDTVLTLQDFYDSLKESAGGSVAMEKLLERIAELEYVDSSVTEKVALKSSFGTGETFDVRNYRTAEAFTEEIEEKFEDVIDGSSYLDDDGEFDAEQYKDYIEETFDYELEESTSSASKYLSAELNEKLGYNYDEYIEEEIIPSLLSGYIYTDYVTSSSKYKGQFSNQYAMRLEVLKLPRDTSKENGNWNTAFVKDVRAILAKALSVNASNTVSFGTDYSFVTFNSNNDMILFETTANELTYSVYENCDAIDALVEKMYSLSTGVTSFKQITVADAKAVAATLTKDAEESWVITTSEKAGQEFYEKVEDVLIARDLWAIDRKVCLAKNYDYKTPVYDAMTESEKSQAESYASTYSSSNSKPMKEVVKSNKITAQRVSYYEEPEYYNKANYTSVLPSTLSSLRGTSAKELLSNLIDQRFLYPKKATVVDPLYLDTASNNYYVCEVSEWYGLYLNENQLDSTSSYKSVTNYHIEAYQAGVLKEYGDSSDYSKVTKEYNYSNAADREHFQSTIELVQVSADNIITDAMKKEAIVTLFEKYGLEINEQIVHDYIKSQYPDYFEEEDE